MSCTVTVHTEVHDSVALQEACKSLSIAAPQISAPQRARVNPPEWKSSVIFDLVSGQARYDSDYRGPERGFNKLLQGYSREKARQELRKQSIQLSDIKETQLEDGTIEMLVTVEE